MNLGNSNIQDNEKLDRLAKKKIINYNFNHEFVQYFCLSYSYKIIYLQSWKSWNILQGKINIISLRYILHMTLKYV